MGMMKQWAFVLAAGTAVGAASQEAERYRHFWNDGVFDARVPNEAVKHLPLVLKYLLRNRIERPAEDEHGLLIGGEFQAWQYREDMREIWLAVPGMRDWLKQFVDRAQAALRRQKSRRRRR